jgi:threonine synthase
MTGLARDGGLYMPESWPPLAPDEIASFADEPYPSAAARIMTPFTLGAASAQDLHALTRQAYASFRHTEFAPLVQIGDGLFILELFHGPTLAFKDFAMQSLALLMERELSRTGERVTVIGATSGDTGAAAIEAFKDRANIDVFILYPHGRVSDVQRRQMTTVDASNVHVLAVEGAFDDCQNIVKALFNDTEFRDAWRLSAVNSINWARIMAQIPYYFTSAAALGAPHRRVSFAVPTGNFGDIFAGYAAKRMGLPIGQLIIATNANDILARALNTGRYEPRGVQATTSPSMDIQISSNFERLLFEAAGRDPARVVRHMGALRDDGGFMLAPDELSAIRADFSAHSSDNAKVAQTISRVYAETGYLLDPHTATGVSAAWGEREKGMRDPIVVLGTAHPAKFPEAVERASGVAPVMPGHLRDIMSAKERFTVVRNDVSEAASMIASRARQLLQTKRAAS